MHQHVPGVHVSLHFSFYNTSTSHPCKQPICHPHYLSLFLHFFSFKKPNFDHTFTSCASFSAREIARIPVLVHTMPARTYIFGRPDEASHPDTLRAALSEFVSTFIFVFAGEGSILALDKLYKETGPPASGLVMVALAHALALFAAVAASINVSGGHVNPAVTFGALVGGRISVVRALFYWIAQLLGAVIASLLLRLVTNGMRPVGFYVSPGEGVVQGLILEMAMTFGLVYVVYATAIDPKRGSLGIIAPLAIGFIVGANILVGGPFDGASMNPARAFGPALVGWRWRNHWIYWVGPFIGGGLAALIYEFMVIPTEPVHHTHHQPLAPEDY